MFPGYPDTPAAYYFFSKPGLNMNFSSDGVRTETALDHTAYFLTDAFINSVFSGQFLPDDMLEKFDLQNPDVFLQELKDEWGTVITYNWRVAIAVIFGFIMCLAVPIFGIVWCVYRCKGKSGRQVKRFKKDRVSRIKRQLSYMGFLVCWPLCLWGIIWNLQADVLFDEGLKALPANVDNVLINTQHYVNNTVTQVDWWADSNFGEFKDSYSLAWTKAEQAFNQEVIVNVLEAVDWERNMNMSRRMLQINQDFEAYKPTVLANMEECWEKFGVWEDSLVDFKTAPELAQLLNDPLVCPDEECVNITMALNNLYLLDTYLGDISVIDEMTVLPEELEVFQANVDFLAPIDEKFMSLSVITAPYTEDVNEILANVNVFLSSEATELVETMNNLAYVTPPEVVSEVQDFIDQWGDVFFWCFQIPAYFIIFTLTIYMVGFCLGLFSPIGGKKRVYAASTLGWGTGLFYSMSIVFWLFTVALFVTGGTIQTLGCKTLEDPESSDLYEMFEDDINEQIRQALNNSIFDNVTWNLPDMIYQCQDDQSVYEILGLHEVYDITLLRKWNDYVETENLIDSLSFNINSTVEDIFKDVVNWDSNSTYDIAQASCFKWIAVQENLDLSNNKHDIKYFLNDTYIPAEEAIAELIARVTALEDPALNETMTKVSDLFDEFTKQGNIFDAYWEGDYLVFTEYFEDMILFEFDSSQISTGEIYMDLYRDDGANTCIDTAILFLEEGGNEQMMEEMIYDYQDVLDIIDGFVEHSITVFTEDVGACAPAFAIYESIINYGCFEIVDPINSIWSGLGAILLFFCPLLLAVWHIEITFRSTEQDVFEYPPGHVLEPAGVDYNDSLETEVITDKY